MNEQPQCNHSKGRGLDFIVLILVLGFLYIVSQPKVTEVEGGKQVSFGGKIPPLFQDTQGNPVEWQDGTYDLYK